MVQTHLSPMNFGPLPLAIGSGDPGREIEGPMATVILGGLVTSTLLNLLVLPTLSLRYGKFEQRVQSRPMCPTPAQDDAHRTLRLRLVSSSVS